MRRGLRESWFLLLAVLVLAGGPIALHAQTATQEREAAVLKARAGQMADGYSRVTGRHGVCIGQNGPGITNYVTAVAAAFWAHSPVVCITPETGSNSMGLGGFQETDQIPIFSKITKYQADIRRGDRIAQLIIAPVAECSLQEVDALPASGRGAGGYGSTGSGA